MRALPVLCLSSACLVACVGSSPQSGSQPVAAVAPSGETEPTGDEANAVALWIDDANPGASLVIGSAGRAGIEVYGLDGARRARVEAGGEVTSLGILTDFPLGGTAVPLVAALVVPSPRVLLYRLDGASGTLAPVRLAGMELSGPYEGLCTYRSVLDGKSYLFLTKATGAIEQWLIEETGSGRVLARLARTLGVSSEAKYCVADPATFSLYVAEEAVGIWRFAADVETETVPEVIDIVRFGTISGEVGGLAVLRNESGQAFLVASDASENRFHVYDINADHVRLGSFIAPAGGAIGAVEEAGGLAGTARPLGASYPAGILVAQDDDNGGRPTNYKFFRWDAIDAALELSARAERRLAQVARTRFGRAEPTVETAPVEADGDAADDPAIWVHPTDPALSTVIGTDKKRGLYVYDLSGKVLQFLPDGRMNNVDVRYGFPLGGRSVDIVAATERTENRIAVYGVDPATRRLSDLAAGTLSTGMTDTYGFCLYRSPHSGRYYAFVNGESGLVRQFELAADGRGRITANAVREFHVGSQAEGCAADDETGALYIAEEDVALWKYSAEPDGGSERTLIASVDSMPELAADLEGVSIYYGTGGAGYIIVSSQGNDSYAVFDRQGEHAYLGSFVITANTALGIDGASETDGLDVISTGLGPAFPNGVFIAQDGRNLMPNEPQNFKFVPWDAIARSLGLEVMRGWDPRAATRR